MIGILRPAVRRCRCSPTASVTVTSSPQASAGWNACGPSSSPICPSCGSSSAAATHPPALQPPQPMPRLGPPHRRRALACASIYPKADVQCCCCCCCCCNCCCCCRRHRRHRCFDRSCNAWDCCAYAAGPQRESARLVPRRQHWRSPRPTLAPAATAPSRH